MPIYISRGRFTTDAVKGMMAKPENREEAVSNLFKSVGGKLIAWYLTFGHHDWLVIGEFPDDKAAASAVLAAAETPVGRRFLCWARFPTFQIQQLGTGRFIVNIVDVRYARRVGARFGAISIPVTLPIASSP